MRPGKTDGAAGCGEFCRQRCMKCSDNMGRRLHGEILEACVQKTCVYLHVDLGKQNKIR